MNSTTRTKAAVDQSEDQKAGNSTPGITLVAAMDKARGIGKDGKMPWHLPDDLKLFKALTLGHPVVMGRKTWESIGFPLPGRLNIVISRNASYPAAGATVATSTDEAISIAANAGTGSDEIMVIGGGAIYQLMLPSATRMVLTLVDTVQPADTHFPDYDESHWQEASRISVAADSRNPFSFKVIDFRLSSF